MTLTINLPWPPTALSPNSRVHWRKLADVKKRYRVACHLAAVQALRASNETLPLRGPLSVRLTFLKPDKRRRDWDNMVASCKAGLDAVSDAVGVDDSQWKLSLDVSDEVVKGGVVKVELTCATT